MPLYRPSELRDFLSSLGIAPRKSLSQNFLIDGNIIRKIVATAKVSAKDLILEIGPGPGSLTEELLGQKATVLAIEKDRTLAPALLRLQTEDGRLHVLEADALKLPFKSALEPLISKNTQRAKVVANLPYHITTPLLTSLLPQHDLFSHIIVMVQDEVAKRICAQPKTADMSSLTLFCNFFSTVEYAFQVKRNSFFPIPNVDSAIVLFTLRPPLLEALEKEFFFSITRLAYQHRRKMLRASLQIFAPTITISSLLESLSLPSTARPEELSLQQFVQLSQGLYPLQNLTSL